MSSNMLIKQLQNSAFFHNQGWPPTEFTHTHACMHTYTRTHKHKHTYSFYLSHEHTHLLPYIRKCRKHRIIYWRLNYCEKNICACTHQSHSVNKNRQGDTRPSLSFGWPHPFPYPPRFSRHTQQALEWFYRTAKSYWRECSPISLSCYAFLDQRQ